VINVPHLETDVTTACQLSCVACNHHVPLWRKRGPTFADPRQVELDLERLSGFLHASVWGALGGEPLLHKSLVEILHIVRDSGICDKIEVWTNGLMLPQMGQSFWRSFDVLVVSIYPGKHTEESLGWIVQKCKDEGVVYSPRDEGANRNFRTLLEETPTSPEETKAKYQGCFFRQFSRVVNNGYFYTCCCAPHMPILLQGREHGADGIAIEGLNERLLRGYLTREEPLEACSMCAGRDTAKPIEWREQRNPDAWIRESAGVV
jgi:cyclic pyranopterin phosphate synthase